MALVDNSIIIAQPASIIAKSSAMSLRLQLVSIFMAESQFKMHQPARGLSNASISVEVGFETGFQINKGSTDIATVCKLTCSGKVVSPGESKFKEGNEVFSITAVYVLESSLCNDLDLESDPTEDLQAFSQVGSVMTIWPSWRDFVMNCSARMGLTPLTLPFAKISRIRETQTAKVDEAIGEVGAKPKP